MAGVWGVCGFLDSAGGGAEAAEELAKATGACVRTGPVGECAQGAGRPLGGLQSSTDTLGDRRGKAGVDLRAVGGLLLRKAAEAVSR